MTWNIIETNQTNVPWYKPEEELNETNASCCFTCGHPLTQEEINSQPASDDRPECDACWHRCLEEREIEKQMLYMYPYLEGADGSTHDDYGFPADWYDIHRAEEFDRLHPLCKQ